MDGGGKLLEETLSRVRGTRVRLGSSSFPLGSREKATAKLFSTKIGTLKWKRVARTHAVAIAIRHRIMGSAGGLDGQRRAR
jgi:hypothetical protein